jgi:hypothetical protein
MAPGRILNLYIKRHMRVVSRATGCRNLVISIVRTRAHYPPLLSAAQSKERALARD